MSLVEKSPDPETISSEQGSRINGIAGEFITLSGAELVLVTTTEGALIARAGEMDTTEIEGVGMISALIYAAAQSIGTSIGTSVSYVSCLNFYDSQPLEMAFCAFTDPVSSRPMAPSANSGRHSD
jgi:hypothetical protein